MIIYLIGAITSLNPGFTSNLATLKKLPPNTAVDVYINSPGGRIDQGFEFAKAIYRLNATCFVEYAASAAFQVVMPGCKKIVMAPKSRLQFHSAGQCVQGNKDAADILNLWREFIADTGVMASLMTNYWGPSQCTKELRQKFADVNASCTVLHMLAENELTGAQFKVIFPKAAHLVTLASKDAFPVIPDPVMEPAVKSPSTPGCEIL